MKGVIRVGWSLLCAVVALGLAGLYLFYTLIGYPAWQRWSVALTALLSLGLGWCLAAVLHEAGHCLFGRLGGMRLQRCAALGCSLERTGKGFQFSVRPSAAAGETSMFPASGSGVKRGYALFALGGPTVSLLFALLTGIAYCQQETLIRLIGGGMFPAAFYLFALNLPPLTYPTGRTDVGVLFDLLRGRPSACAAVRILTIQGMLYEGKRPREIPSELYFQPLNLPEDAPEFMAMIGLQYLYHLDGLDFTRAAACTERLVSLDDALSDEAYRRVNEDFLFDCVCLGESECADKLYALWGKGLEEDPSLRAKRIVAYYRHARGEMPAVEGGEEIFVGLRRFEEALLAELAA